MVSRDTWHGRQCKYNIINCPKQICQLLFILCICMSLVLIKSLWRNKSILQILKFINHFTMPHVFEKVLSLQFFQIYDPNFWFNKSRELVAHTVSPNSCTIFIGRMNHNKLLNWMNCLSFNIFTDVWLFYIDFPNNTI